jgi:NAD(P)H-dependent flavin oxidoreductase YrpB (nitropropane dioxygenase family)
MSEKAQRGSSLEDSWVKGDLDTGTLPAGQVFGLISSIKSVREIIEEMVKPYPQFSPNPAKPEPN